MGPGRGRVALSAISEQHRFWGQVGEAYRRATLEMISGAASPSPSVDDPDTMDFVLRMRPVDPELISSTIARWERELSDSADDAVHVVAIGEPVCTGPAGTVVLTPGSDAVWLGWSCPHPGLLVKEGPVADAVRALYRSWPFPVVGLRGTDAAHPEMDRDRPVLTDEELSADAPEVQVRPPYILVRGKPAVLTYDSTVSIGMRDPMSRLLFLLSSSLGWELPAFGFPALPVERNVWKHLPRLELPGGAILSPRRWTVDGDALGSLRVGGAAQYLAWRKLADDLGWPRRVACRWEAHPLAPTLTLPATSTLAVRAVLGAIPESTARLIVSEVPPPSVIAPDGSRCVGEIGAIWHDPGFWAATR